MEGIRHVRMTFENLQDVKDMYHLCANAYGSTTNTAARLNERGVPINSRIMADVRAETQFLASALLGLADEFMRLHPIQCDNPLCETAHRNVGEIEKERQEFESNVIVVLRMVNAECKVADSLGLISEQEECSILEALLREEQGED